METVGFIGLGNMGGPVAGHIQRAGFPMVVYDLREEATRRFEERGAKVADSAAELARQQRRRSSPRCRCPRTWSKSPAARMESRRDKAATRFTSISPPVRLSLIRQLEPLFRAKGAFVLDAPVASGQPGAARGIHEVMVGGERGNLSSAPSRCCARSAIKCSMPVRWAREASASSCIR